MPSGMRSPIVETRNITVNILRGLIHPLFTNLTWMEWMLLATGDPARTTTCILVRILKDILELFIANALDSLPKDNCSTEAIEAIVGNKLPEAFAKVVKVGGEVRTEHTDNLNHLIVKYVVERVNSILDSDSNDNPRNHVDEAINDMVGEIKVVVKDLFVRLHASSKEPRKAVVRPVEPQSMLKGLKGRIKGFFTKFTRKHSSRVAPVNLPEKPGISHIMANKTVAMEALIPPEIFTKDLLEEELHLEARCHEISPVEAYIPQDDVSDIIDLETYLPEILSTKGSQVQSLELEPRFEIIPREAFVYTKTLQEEDFEPEPKFDEITPVEPFIGSF
ncbi:uncharacterized protein LOC111611825 [Xiphophorus maculatus]|uniref:uncharacterized protein LOC111611825 n=1 Tax=Xiphophorus maculatus TaxID=8083 RepID=UPI000C6CA404|nr:uncharacterized protein LOC111611825 [Xiphophorus maculatus]